MGLRVGRRVRELRSHRGVLAPPRPSDEPDPSEGGSPQLYFTTTPREKKVLWDLLENPLTVFTEAATTENVANLPKDTVKALNYIYQGTRLGEQELGGKLLGRDPGALFDRGWFNDNRSPAPRRFKRKIVAVDTSGSGKDTACECGIVVLGLSEDGLAYVLEDASLRASPEEWARRMYKAYLDHGCDEILYESNYGGELIPTMFRQMGLKARFRPVAAKGTKAERAQPVSALTQRGRVKFTQVFKDLEMQCCTWTPRDRKSPDRMDAYVHGVAELFPSVVVPRGELRIPGFF